MKKASLRLSRHVRHLNTYAGHEARPFVKIREVSPRDGLQNEPTSLDAATKARYIRDLARAGMYFIEAGSFVSPKVKQMANTREVLLSPEIADLLSSNYNERPVSLSVLIPNMRGYQDFRDTLQELGSRGLDASRLEIAIFVSATEAFSKANLNASRAEALDRLARVVEEASKHATKVRGYVSCVVKVIIEVIYAFVAGALTVWVYSVRMKVSWNHVK